MGSPLVGTWKLISETREGLAVFTETNFSLHVSEKRTATADAAFEANQTMRLSGGTYTVDGSAAVLHYGLSGRPDYVGKDLRLEFAIEGARMTIQGTQPDGVETAESTWERAEH